MTRLTALVCACVLVSATALSAQARVAPPANTSGQRGTPPPKGARTADPQTRAQIQKLREDLKKDQDEAQRLQKAVQLDKQSGDKQAGKRDADALQQVRKDIKKDQDEIKRLQSQSGRGGV